MSITLKDYIKAIDYAVAMTGEYMWQCFGDESFFLDGRLLKKGRHAHEFTAVYDSGDQTVYEVEHWDYETNRIYKWLNPKYKKKYMAEAKRRGVNEKTDSDFVVTYVEPQELLNSIRRAVRRSKSGK